MQNPVETVPSLRQIGQMLVRHKRKMSVTFLLCVATAIAVTAFMQPAYRSEAKLFVRLGRENAVLDSTATMGQGPIMAVPQSREDEINSVVEILQSEVLLKQLMENFGPAAILGAPVEVDNQIVKAQVQVPGTTVAHAAPAVVLPATASTSATGSWGDRLSDFWNRIGPGPDSTAEEQAIGKLRRRLMVFAPKKSNVITLRYDGPSPRFSQALVDKLVDLYLSQHITLNRTPRSHDFFSNQTDELRTRLSETEQKLRDMKDETGISSVTEQQRILVERLGKLEDDKLTTDANLAVAVAELTSLEDRLKELPPSLEVSRVDGLSNQAFDLMRQRLYELQLREQQLLSVFTEEWFQVREVRREIAEAQRILDREEAKSTSVTTAKNKAHEETEMEVLDHRTEVASLQAKAEKLQEQLHAAHKELEQLNHHQMRITQLEREVELQDTQFRAYSRNLEQARIDQALETNRISNISVVQPATIAIEAVRPNKLMNLGLGILMGGFASLCLALAAEYFDHSLRTVEDVESRLGIPALGSLPRTQNGKFNGNITRESHDQPLAR